MSGFRRKETSAECRCDYNFTCGYCLKKWAWKATGPEVPPVKREKITVQVFFANGDNIVTGFFGSLNDAEQYYLGKRFNIGSGDRDLETIGEKVVLL